MVFKKYFKLSTLALVSTLALTACKSVEERVGERFQSALTLAESGDFDRAIVTLRSVFELDGSHFEARRTLANILLNEKGNRQGAYSQFLRLAEQYPDDLDVRVILTELAFSGRNWEEFQRHSDAAQDLAPDDPRVEAISIAEAYRAAALDEDNSARREQARAASTLLSELADNTMLQSIIIDNHLNDGEFEEALIAIDRLLELEPDNPRVWQQRQGVLVRLEDFEGLEAQLRMMIERFPEEISRKAALVRFFIVREEPDKAETFLRELAADSENLQGRVDLIRFIGEVRGTEAARAEIEKMISERPDEVVFRVLRARLDFNDGQREEAIADLEAVLKEAVPLDQVNGIKLTLARMLLQMDNNVGAQLQVEEILNDDSANAGALKMRAAWQIEADETDAAVANLRLALDQNADDVVAMNLMAQAYLRSGQPDLARDFLALAVDASGNAPEQTIQYARVLIGDGRYVVAEDILLPALRLSPKNVDLLLTLGRLYLAMEDYGRGDQVVQSLRSLDIERAKDGATRLEAELINRRQGPEQAIDYLEGIAQGADASLSAKISLLQARLASGDIDGALKLARDIQSGDPENVRLNAMLATTEAISGNLDEAEVLYRGILDTSPDIASIWVEMARIKIRQGDPEAARAVIEEALGILPNSRELLWSKASYLERDGRTEDAIGVYEALYASNSSSVIMANNLASLLSTYYEDEESLNRSWIIARRFRDLEEPAIQDTYGWIIHRRGETEDALEYLKAAAEGLPNDAIVQFHLAEVYFALDKPDLALQFYRTAVDLAGVSDQRRQILKAKDQIQLLESASGVNE